MGDYDQLDREISNLRSDLRQKADDYDLTSAKRDIDGDIRSVRGDVQSLETAFRSYREEVMGMLEERDAQITSLRRDVQSLKGTIAHLAAERTLRGN